LSAALPRYTKRYEAILVDEGQDFCDLWWLPVEELLADKAAGCFYITAVGRQRSGSAPCTASRGWSPIESS
jgi:hypothetical protein